MKKFLLRFFILLILHLLINNPTDDSLLSAQFLVQGSVLDPFTGELRWILDNMLFHTGMFILFMVSIFSRISQIVDLRTYVIARGGEVAFKCTLVKKTLWEIGKILMAKSLIYLFLFIIEQRVSRFALYDMVSTFLTLSLFSLVFMICQLKGISNKIPLFALIAGNLILQIWSFEIQSLSIVVIASIYWQEAPVIVIAIKALIVLLLSCFMFFTKNVDHMLEVKNND